MQHSAAKETFVICQAEYCVIRCAVRKVVSDGSFFICDGDKLWFRKLQLNQADTYFYSIYQVQWQVN